MNIPKSIHKVQPEPFFDAVYRYQQATRHYSPRWLVVVMVATFLNLIRRAK